MIKRFTCLFILSIALSSLTFAQNNIVQAKGGTEDRFPKIIGSLRFSHTTTHLGNVFTNEIKVDTIKIYNSSTSTITLNAGTKIPEHISLSIQPEKLEPQAEGFILLNYQTDKRKEFGFVFDRIIFSSNDPVQPDKNLNVTATIKEYFPPQIEGDSILLQRANVTETSVYLGHVIQGDKAKHEFRINNDGQKDLLIHHAKSDCGCVITTFSKKVIPPGDQAVVEIEFDSFAKEGDVFVDVLVFVNDPLQPEIRFSIQAAVRK